MSVRLNKLLAQRGIAARRKCDELIRSGLVRVNGAVVTEPGTQVEPQRDRVLVRGRPLPAAASLRYFVLNKPVGVITTMHDPEGRRTVAGMLPPGGRTYPVGRLDADTSGLLILTNDGELAHRLMHPRYGVEKQYKVRVSRAPSPGQLARLRDGVEFEPGIVSQPARVHLFEAGDGAVIGIALHEGRYRQVRRMCEAVGLPVVTLHRAAYGPLRLGPLERGTWRELSAAEVAALKEACARPRGPRLSRFDLAQRKRAPRGAPRGSRPEPVSTSPREARAKGKRAARGSSSQARLGNRPRPTSRPAAAGARDTRRPARGGPGAPVRSEFRPPLRGGAGREEHQGREEPRGRDGSRPRGGPGRKESFGPRRARTPGGPPRNEGFGPRKARAPGGPPRNEGFGPRKARAPGGPRRDEGFGPRKARAPGGPRRNEGFGPREASRAPGGPRRTEGFGPRKARTPGGPRRTEGFGPREASRIPGAPRRSEGFGPRKARAPGGPRRNERFGPREGSRSPGGPRREQGFRPRAESGRRNDSGRPSSRPASRPARSTGRPTSRPQRSPGRPSARPARAGARPFSAQRSRPSGRGKPPRSR